MFMHKQIFEQGVYPTHLPFLNASMYRGGLGTSMFCLLSSYPKGYKTMFSVNLATYYASMGVRVLYLTFPNECGNVSSMLDIHCKHKSIDKDVLGETLRVSSFVEGTLEMNLLLSSNEGFSPEVVILDPFDALLGTGGDSTLYYNEDMFKNVKNVLLRTGVMLFATVTRSRDRNAERHYDDSYSVRYYADLIMHLNEIDSKNSVNLDITHSRYGIARIRHCLEIDAKRCIIRE